MQFAIIIIMYSSGAPAYNCVVVSSTHQEDKKRFPESCSHSCMVNCVVAFAHSALNRGFDSAALDHILAIGYKLYPRVRRDHDFLMCDELPNVVHYMGHDLHIIEKGDIFITANGDYPHYSRHFSDAVDILSATVASMLEVAPPQSYFLFTGHSRTVAFWQRDGDLLFFDSHGVNAQGVHDMWDDTLNKCRLFLCENTAALAGLLLAQSPMDGDTAMYGIDRVVLSLERPVTQPPCERQCSHPSPAAAISPRRSGRRTPPPGPSALSKRHRPNVDLAPSPGSSPLPSAHGSDSDVPLRDRVPKKRVKGRPKGSRKKRREPTTPAVTSSPPVSQASETANTPPSPSSSLLVNAPPKKRGGRPRKQVRGRPKGSKNKPKDVILPPVATQPLTPSALCVSPSISGEVSDESIALSQRAAISRQKYQETHPDRVKGSRDKYRATNPSRVAASSQTYSMTHPEQVTAFRDLYTATHPEEVIVSREDYRAAHPEEVIASREEYRATHPEEVIASRDNYTASHAREVAESSSDYRARNRAIRAERQREYVRLNPAQAQLHHLSPAMRSLVIHNGPVGYWQGDLLNHVQPHQLRVPDPSMAVANLHDPRTRRCQYCKAALFEEEKGRSQWCCHKGLWNVLRLPPLEAPFYESTQFLDRARAYNDMFAFCAMGVSGGYKHPSGLSFLRVEGRMYHKIYDINLRGQSFRTRLQGQQYINHSRLYIDDGVERSLLAEGRGLDQDVIQDITDYLDDVNPLIPQYKLLGRQQAVSARLQFEETTRARHGANLGERNCGIEVQAVLNTSDDPDLEDRLITVWLEGAAKPRTLSIFSELMEPMQYPLLYPHGTRGWSYDMRDNNNQKLTLYKYSRCLLLSEPRFAELGRLSQSWEVEMFARYEEEKLRYLRKAQSGPGMNRGGTRLAPRDELESHVSDRERTEVALTVAADETVQGEGGARAGKLYLPSTFVGSPRYMKLHYLDSMALVSRLGVPDLFVTYTCSGQWTDLKGSTRHGSPCDPPTCCRVFQLKQEELIRDFRSGAFAGELEFDVYTIEVQLRGLPHQHWAIKLKNGRLTQARDIDRIIRADIPGPEEAGGRLRALVLKHMVHGPCGRGYRTHRSPCWDKDKDECSKQYPKPECETTHMDERGFVHYKRDWSNTAVIRQDGRDVTIHDGFIVPYNPYLLLKYDCHINVEVCTSRRVIAYLYKYIFKGQTLQNVRVVPQHLIQDEIEDYATKRVLGATDACWRMLGFPVTHSLPTVQQLTVHLEGKQCVMFAPGKEREALAAANVSKLCIYFDRPLDAIFDNLLYHEFHEQYIIRTQRPGPSCRSRVYECVGGRHFVTHRLLGRKVCRLFWIQPNRGELYYLRVLLSSVPCRGFQDLLRRGGDDCTSFQEVARLLGLIDDEMEYHNALLEAATFMVGARLRSFFVLLCNVGGPAPLLWDAHRDLMCADLLDRFPADPERAHKLGLLQIDRALRRQGSCLRAMGLPYVEDDSTELGRELMNYNSEAQAEIVNEWLPLLSEDQSRVWRHVKMLLDREDQRQPLFGVSNAIFLDGPGGYGKTALLNVIIAYGRSQGKVVIVVGSSAIAAGFFKGGTTPHNMFKLPLDLGGGLGVWGMTNDCQRAKLIKQAAIIIFDEAPMSHRHLHEMLDRSLRDLTGLYDLPFGGKIYLAAGDFRQIAPVVRKAKTPHDVISASLRVSYLWPSFKVFRLTTPQRAREAEWARYLLDVGDGVVPERAFGEGNDLQMLIPVPRVRFTHSLQELLDFVFPPDVIRDADACACRAVLSTINLNVREVNGLLAAAIDEHIVPLVSADSLSPECDEGNNMEVDIDLMHQARAQGVPDHVLELQVGSLCFITRNLDLSQGLVNGTRVVVLSISPAIITVRKAGRRQVDGGLADELTYAIPRISFTFPLTEGSPVIIRRRQFPLQLCKGTSVHKSQGSTLDKEGADYRTAVFSHGMQYVTLTRGRSPEDIMLLVAPEHVVDGVPYVRNIVYKDLLL